MLPSISFLLRFCIWCLCLGTLKFSFCVEDTNMRCLESERQALIIFKRGLKDSDNKLSSWVGDDCCGWEGIHCNNKTGHVVKLILRSQIQRQISSLTDDQLESMTHDDLQSLLERSCLSGEIKSSLLELKYLKHLDLSINCFGGISIPKFIGSFNNLRYLNLSMAGFGGRVPHELGNLSTLRYLDLNNDFLWLPVYTSDGYLVDFVILWSNDLHVDRLHWLSRLSSLQHLDMTRVNLSKATDWLLSINMLPSIINLQLSSCILPNISTPLSVVNLTSLSTLDLSFNFLGPKIPTWLLNISRIVSLDLRHNGFTFPIPASFGSLCNLQTINLRGNNFEGDINRFNESFKGCIRGSLENLDLDSNKLSGYLPDWLGQFTNLKSLSLSENSLSGFIPSSLWTLSSLRELDISSNSLFGSISPSLGTLSSLKRLLLRRNSLSDSIPPSLGTLSSLRELDLSSNSLSGSIPPSLGTLTSLRELVLFSNSLSGSIPPSLGTLPSLSELDLSSNSLSGSIPSSIGTLSSLRKLDLSSNSLSGSIPPSLGALSSLRALYLFGNKLNGSIPKSLRQLSNLVALFLSDNSFEGVLSEAHFSNLLNLKYVSMSSNSLFLNVSSNWVPPFQLTYIAMDGCKIGPQFPQWIQSQKKLKFLSLSNASISDTIPPDFLWNFSSDIDYIDLSCNSISSFITHSIGEKTTNLQYLSLSSNHLKGSIPLSMCEMKNLAGLDLSNNQLTNEIPQCLGDMKFLKYLNLQNNGLFGGIPSSISHLSQLESLHLSRNKLSGKVPPSMKNCTRLITLDLGENRFSGKIPKWIGERLTFLTFLVLRSNMFDGNLPPQLSLLSKLQVLDLSQNNLSGTIPDSFENFSAMAVANKTNEIISYYYTIGSNLESIWVSWKGSQFEYSHTISLVINIDLSSNNLHGEIPKEIARLFGLQSLNLSKNHLTGTIPQNISDLRWIESMDLSWNQLSGGIPHSLAYLTFLSHLNLSHNNFSGRIPSGRQLDTINDSSIYIGNPFLCGPPISSRCPGDETAQESQPNVDDKEEDKDELVAQLFYIGMGLGFVLGFWVVCGILLFKRSWRIAYYRFFDDIGDRIYVAIAIKVARFKKNEALSKNRGLEMSRKNASPCAFRAHHSG